MSAGALDSPKLLLLSGIGPKAELSKLHIPIIADLPDVGKNLCDRLFLELVSVRQADSHHRTSYITSPDALEEARDQWNRDGSGPLAGYYLPQMIGYFKSDKVIQSEEFQELDSELQRALIAETKPHFEMVSVRSIDFSTLVSYTCTLSSETFLLTTKPPPYSIIQVPLSKLPKDILEWPQHSKETMRPGDPLP